MNKGKLILSLNEQLVQLQKSLDNLKLSKEKVKKLIGNKKINFEESESIDSFTSKLARTSDIYVQKVIRSVWILIDEPKLPFIDIMNKCESFEIIRNADELLEIREIRNKIAHEYIEEDMLLNLSGWLKTEEVLESNIQKTIEFIKARNW